MYKPLSKSLPKPLSFKRISNVSFVTLSCALCVLCISLCGCSSDSSGHTEAEYEALKQQKEYLQAQLDALETDTDTDTYKESTNTNSEEEKEEPIVVSLSNGTYKVGTDITAGTYDVEATSGYGKIKGDFASGFLSMGIGISDRNPDHKGYNNLELTTGDEFEISNGVTLQFTPQ